MNIMMNIILIDMTLTIINTTPRYSPFLRIPGLTVTGSRPEQINSCTSTAFCLMLSVSLAPSRTLRSYLYFRPFRL